MTDQTRFQGIVEFVETARTGSFTGAAGVLGLTGSAVGKSVSRLEQRLGAKLLHRTTRRLTLTPDGEAYLEACLRIVEDLDGAESGLSSGRSDAIGKLRLDVPGAFGRRHIMPTLTDLSMRHRRLDLSVMFTERTADIIAEGVDLAVRIGTLDDDSGLVARRLGTQRLMFVAAPTYLAEYGAPASIDELTTRDCIIGWRRTAKPSWLLREPSGRFVRHEIRVRHEFSDGEAMVAVVLAGCGISQLPTWLIADHLAADRLVPVLETFSGAEMPIHAVWPRSKYVQPRLRMVIDALSQAAAREGSGFNP